MCAKPVQLRCDYQTNPLGIDDPKPVLSWQSDSQERNWRQSAYQILVATNAQMLSGGKADVWDSGKVNSSSSVSIPYGGPVLESRRRYFWTVRTWDTNDEQSQSSEGAWWEMGLLSKSDWNAQWIAWQNPQTAADEAGIRWIWAQGQDALLVPPKTKAEFRLEFTLSSLPERAALFLIARGDWQVKVNGHEAGEKPHWNEFDRREIAGFLQPGRNVVEINVDVPSSGPGFPPNPDQPHPAALAALVKIVRHDGAIDRFPTGNHWQARLSESRQWQPAQIAALLHDPRMGPDPGPLPQPAALLRREFTIGKPIESARAYITALGSYRLFLNGKQAAAMC